jgi:hypothetical protein
MVPAGVLGKQPTRHPHPERSQGGVREAEIAVGYPQPTIARVARRAEILDCRNHDSVHMRLSGFWSSRGRVGSSPAGRKMERALKRYSFFEGQNAEIGLLQVNELWRRKNRPFLEGGLTRPSRRNSSRSTSGSRPVQSDSSQEIRSAVGIGSRTVGGTGLLGNVNSPGSRCR